LGSFVADIIRSETGADVVLYNGGTLRSDSTYGPGELTLKHLVSILPFPDPIVVIEVTGEQLKAALGTR
jgi:2',3'-cyclic-nucleotide 2'-phosphodiesterase (5'-nucleotidase family)